MEEKTQKEIIDIMIQAACALEEAETAAIAARHCETSAKNDRDRCAWAYNTALDAYLKIFPKVTV